MKGKYLKIQALQCADIIFTFNLFSYVNTKYCPKKLFHDTTVKTAKQVSFMSSNIFNQLRKH